MYSHIAVFVFLALSGQLADLCCGETVEFEFGNLRAIKRTMEGYKATTKLLKGAHPLSQAKRTTSFWKSGDYSTAMADFKGVDPSDVHDMALPAGVVRKMGIAGDRIITVEHTPKTGWTRLTISKNSGTKKETTKEILYMHVLSPVHKF